MAFLFYCHIVHAIFYQRGDYFYISYFLATIDSIIWGQVNCLFSVFESPAGVYSSKFRLLGIHASPGKSECLEHVVVDQISDIKLECKRCNLVMQTTLT